MATDHAVAELKENFNHHDLVKAKLVIKSLAGADLSLQQEAVDFLTTTTPEFALPLLGELLDMKITEVAIPRLEIAAEAAVLILTAPKSLSLVSKDAQIHIITALGEVNHEQALKPLRMLLVSHPPSANVRFTIYEALSKLPMTAGGYMLAAGLDDEDELVRMAAARAIERNFDSTLQQGLINHINDHRHDSEAIVAAIVQAAALKTIEGLLADDTFADLLGKRLSNHAEPELLAKLSPILYHSNRQSLLAQVGAALSVTDTTDQPLIYAVDDSKLILKMFQSMLTDMGCRIVTFENPFEAIEWVQKSPPDLMFTDLNMPEINGIELTSTIRSSPTNNDFPIVMVTTQEYGEDIEQAMNAGVDSFIQKPFKKEALTEAINSLTEHDIE